MRIRSADSRRPACLRPAGAAAILAALCLAIGGCSRSGGSDGGDGAVVAGAGEPGAPGASSASRDITIPRDAQGEYGGLRIGVGPVGTGEYVLDSGEREKGRVAELWLYYRDDPSKNAKMKVYIGQRVEIGKYAFRVADIHGGRGSVQLRFETAP